MLVVFPFFLVGRRSSQGGKARPSQPWPCSPTRRPAGSRSGWPHGRRPGAAPPCGRSVCVSSTLISGHERASSQSPHSWTLHTGVANRKKKLFLRPSRKVGSCLLIVDRIKNAWLQMFLLRTSEAGGWMWGKKKFHPVITWDKKLLLWPLC